MDLARAGEACPVPGHRQPGSRGDAGTGRAQLARLAVLVAMALVRSRLGGRLEDLV